MKTRHQRVVFIALALGALSIASWLVLGAFNENLVFFFSPTQVVENVAPSGTTFRIGGLVVDGSLRRSSDGLTSSFTITDTVNSVPVVYKGLLPDLFREGRGCVAQGRIGRDGTFRADMVLAKHDENYMPAEAAESIERARSVK